MRAFRVAYQHPESLLGGMLDSLSWPVPTCEDAAASTVVGLQHDAAAVGTEDAEVAT